MLILSFFSNTHTQPRYGYGLEYQYEPNGAYERQKGYGFVKAYGRDFCKDKLNCNNEERDEQKDNHFKNGAVLNLNYFDNNLNVPNQVPNSITNSESGKSVDSASDQVDKVLTNSDQVVVDDDKKNELNKSELKTNIDYITRIYHLNKDAAFSDTMNSNLISNAPNYLLNNFKLNNYQKNQDTLPSSSNSMLSNYKSNLKSILNSSNKLGQIDHFNHINHDNLNSEQQQIDHHRKLMPNQNSQLIDTSSRTNRQQPIYLASNHYNHFDDDEYQNEYYKEHYDPFAERYSLPKIVHSAAKQLKKQRHSSFSNHNNYRLTNYKNDYSLEDMLDTHLLGATRLQPKFLKTLPNEQAAKGDKDNLTKEQVVTKNLIKNSNETKSASNLTTVSSAELTNLINNLNKRKK